MKTKNLSKLIGSNESMTIEGEPSFSQINEIIESITAFSNTEGGTSLNREFEVTRDNTKNVVLRYKETRLGGGIKFKFNQYIQSSISAGGIFDRSLKYRDGQGKVNIKDGLYTEFRIEIKS